MFHQFPPTNNRRHLIDRQICICKRFYRLRFGNVICHVILSTHHVVLLLVVLSCVLVMSCFGHILLKKAGLDSGLWTLDSGPPPAPSPQQENIVKKKLLQITLPHHPLKLCRKRNRNNVFGVEHTWACRAQSLNLSLGAVPDINF